MIEIKNLSKVFNTEEKKLNEVAALKDINLTINDGDIFGIIGMSGAGKSTLVRCMNMLERPTSGSVLIDGKDIGSFSSKELRALRSKIAMIFQGFNLLMQRTCLDNICFPLELRGIKKSIARKKAFELLETVGLPDKAQSFPSQLSGGQQQRIAIARALATEPKVLLCDEATSALDPKTTESILDLIKSINEKTGITVVVITHQMNVVEKICNKVAILDGGKIVEEGEVQKVFMHPKSETAKHLVIPDNAEGFDEKSFSKNKKVLRAVFNGKTSADSSLIALLAKEKNIMANIRYAATKSILNKAYGNMILELEDDEKIVKEAIDFFSENNVTVEVLN